MTLPEIPKLDINAIPLPQRNEMEGKARALLFSVRREHRDVIPLFSYEGYEHFYWGLFSRPLPRHVERWMREFFDGYALGERRFLVKAFTGATKTTVFTVALSLYYLAEFPDRGVLIVQSSDDAGFDTSSQMADIIKNNPGWRIMCPDIVPDPEKGWGARGYEVKVTSQDYNKWRESVIKNRTTDPSFVALGWSSGEIVKMHPHLLLIDDIHNEDNTRSEREMRTVVDTLKSTILQRLNRPPGDEFKPMLLVSYTPWSKDDAYAYLESTGLYHQIRTPLYTLTEESDPKGFEYEGEFVRLAWDGVDDPVKYLNDKKTEQGGRDFSIKSLLDLEKAATRRPLPYYEFAADAISFDWPTVGGADPRNTFRNAIDAQDNKTSYFALAYVSKVPMGGAVVVDGILERCSLVEAEGYLLKAQTMFPHWLYTRLEDVGGGKVTLQAFMMNPNLKVIGSNLSDLNTGKGRIRSKADRLLTEMMPWFERGVVKVSNRRSIFLDAFRRLFTNFYDLNPEHSAEFDAGDAVYHALKGMPDVLVLRPMDDELPTVLKQKKASPFMFGRLP